MSELGVPQPHSFENPQEADEMFFIGDTAFWRLYREEIVGETNRALSLIPVMHNGERHDVVWLERTRINPDTGESYKFHHAACKCLAEAEFCEIEGMQAIQECEAWRLGIYQRAADIKHKSQADLDEMLALSVQLRGIVFDNIPLEDPELDPVDEAILHHLRVVKSRPQHWEGNILGGQHQLPLLSIITGRELPFITGRVEGLMEAGYVEFDGDQTVKLPA